MTAVNHKKTILFLLVFLSFSQVFSAVYYVAPDGNDGNPGTFEMPFASVQRAQSAAQPGDTVYIHGGNYVLTEADISRVHQNLFACITFLDKSGTNGNTIKYWAYPGERPVFDFSAVKPADQRVVGFYITASYLHLKGLEMTGVQVTITTHTESYCIYSFGSHNIYEQLTMHDNQGTGIRHRQGGYNLFLNCDSYRNHDYTSENGRGGNTDGFGCHPTYGGKGNVFRGCRAWFNSDDGYDVIGSYEPVTFENCWAMYNGYSTSFQSLGDGNGFKAGGEATLTVEELPDPIPRHTVQFCLAVRNKASGFYSNHHIGGINWYNNTAYRNANNYNMLNRLEDNATDVPGYDHRLRNNLGYKARSSEITNINYDLCDNSHNYFDLDVTVSDADFVSLDEQLLVQPRQPDGSLPDNDFMKLNYGSDLVDKGEDIGFIFYGAAPDLGAFEQAYFPFPDSNATWYQFYHPSFDSENGTESRYMIFGLSNEDTIIQGSSYHRLFMFENESLDPETASYVGALREEASGKIYYRGDHPFAYPVTDTGEIMLYDFSAQVGDTIREGVFTSNEYLVVSAIDQVMIGNGYRKRIRFEGYPYTSWIEGVGNDRGLLFYSGQIPLNGLWGDLICFWQNGEELYHHPEYDNCFVGSPDIIIPALHESDLIIYPNPVNSDYLNIDSGTSIKLIRILSNTGHAVKTINPSGEKSCLIQTDELPTGIYFVYVTDVKERVVVRKLVIL